MLIEYEDFNGVGSVIDEKYAREWRDVEQAIKGMLLHVKASDQAGIQGQPIFDAVGTNAYLKEVFSKRGWLSNIPIPEEYRFLGTDVDFGKEGVIVEVQFANYPFLLNNLMRSELLHKSRTLLADEPTELLVIVTKAHMFPASQSTLHYEQAVRQVEALAENDVFDVPIRLVGLFESKNSTVNSVWTDYANPRYSRTVVNREERKLQIQSGKSPKSRCALGFI